LPFLGPRKAATSMSGPLLPDLMPKRVDLMSAAITATELATLPEIVAQSAKIVAPHQDPDLPAVAEETIADLLRATAETKGVDLPPVEAVKIAGIDTVVGLVLPEIQEEAARTVEAGHQGAADRAGAVRGIGVVSSVE
jgi:hypothetical protein